MHVGDEILVSDEKDCMQKFAISSSKFISCQAVFNQFASGLFSPLRKSCRHRLWMAQYDHKLRHREKLLIEPHSRQINRRFFDPPPSGWFKPTLPVRYKTFLHFQRIILRSFDVTLIRIDSELARDAVSSCVRNCALQIAALILWRRRILDGGHLRMLAIRFATRLVPVRCRPATNTYRPKKVLTVVTGSLAHQCLGHHQLQDHLRHRGKQD